MGAMLIPQFANFTLMWQHKICPCHPSKTALPLMHYTESLNSALQDLTLLESVCIVRSNISIFHNMSQIQYYTDSGVFQGKIENLSFESSLDYTDPLFIMKFYVVCLMQRLAKQTQESTLGELVLLIIPRSLK